MVECDRFHDRLPDTPQAQEIGPDFGMGNAEHLLLGLIKLGQGVAVNVLQKMGLDLETVRQEVEKEVRGGNEPKAAGNIPYTPRVKKVLALAAKEAKALNHTYVGTEHILLGLLREGDGVAAKVLRNLDVDIEQCRQEILKELDPQFQQSVIDSTINDLNRARILTQQDQNARAAAQGAFGGDRQAIMNAENDRNFADAVVGFIMCRTPRST